MDSKKYIGMDVHKESISIAVRHGVTTLRLNTGYANRFRNLILYRAISRSC
jgi:hypothetical protein